MVLKSGALPPQPICACFSTHSRGVQLFDARLFCDCSAQWAAASSHLRDIASSLWYLLLIQSWLTVYALIVTICSVAFYCYVRNGLEGAALDWTSLAFAILLPTAGFTWWAFGRREAALGRLADVKVCLLHISLAHRDWLSADQLPGDHQETVHHTLQALMDCMQDYFWPPRFYSRHYPYFQVRQKMMGIARDRAAHVRRLSALFKRLSTLTEVLRRGGLSDVMAIQLNNHAFRLQQSFEHMSNVKEFRTPQVVRAAARVYIILLVPLFYGPYYAQVRQESDSFAFALFFAIISELALVTLLNAAMALEDPFDNLGLDGIYLDEALYEVEQAMLMDEDTEIQSGALVISHAGGGASTYKNLHPREHRTAMMYEKQLEFHCRAAHLLSRLCQHEIHEVIFPSAPLGSFRWGLVVQHMAVLARATKRQPQNFLFTSLQLPIRG
ncbi:hypothetical protein WJX84_001115 [Apatococcus fuscideae]|uniref:DUF4220 domain-containing protein n=1 Tax=Apatococcus fuscideae TaxID=2026836 RepID=A0AAW1TFR2_9CHLO